jgi:hypothetical protein
MNNLQKIIEENEKKFNNWPLYQVPSNCTEVIGYDKNGTAYAGVVINHRDISLRLIEGFREMVREKHRKLLGSVEENDIWRSGYNRAIDDLLSELGSINEIK